jgi:hypothetical protein
LGLKFPVLAVLQEPIPRPGFASSSALLLKLSTANLHQLCLSKEIGGVLITSGSREAKLLSFDVKVKEG